MNLFAAKVRPSNRLKRRAMAAVGVRFERFEFWQCDIPRGEVVW